MDDTEAKDLDEMLADLHDEISRTDSVSDEEQAALQRLDDAIHRLLNRSGRKQPAEGDVLEQLEDSIEELEVEHPTLTKLVSQVLNALSNAGI